MVKRRPATFFLLALCLLSFMAGRPWLLMGDERPLNEEEGYASAQDLSPGPAFSQAAHHGANQNIENNEKWTFTAERVAAQHDSEYIEASGDATFRKGQNVLRADFARYYQATGWIVLKGNVRCLWEGDFLEAEEAEFDLRSKTGWLKSGKVFVAKPHLYFESDYIRKYSADSYEFKNAKVTACSGQTPDWSFEAEEGEIVIDDYAKLWHTTFNIRDVPVAYLPYIELPSSGERKSGFLFPELASSDRFGLQVNLPYYWAINEEMDATFYQNAMSQRGYMQGLELRMALDANTKGMVRFDWLHDSKTYASYDDEDDDSLIGDDEYLRPNSERWWLRSKFNTYLGTPSWRVMADVDLVSDQDYLKEFNHGYSGYQASRDEFIEEFGRDIDPADDLERTSTALVVREYDDFQVSGKVEYTQNLAYFNGNGEAGDNPSLQRLPELAANLYKDAIGDSMAEFQLDSELAFFTREFGTTGGRLEIAPTVSVPLQTPWFTAIPSVGAHQIFYFGTDHETDGNQTLPSGRVEGNGTDEDEFQQRMYVETAVSVFSEIYRTFDYTPTEALALIEGNVGNSELTGLKHSIIPRVDYIYVPVVTGLSDYPYYDVKDRPLSKNEVTYSLTNLLDRKVETVSLVAQGGEVVPALTSQYTDFLSFRLKQTFDFNEAKRKDDLDEYKKRPFSDLMVEFRLEPTAGLSLTSKTFISPYEGQVTEHEHMLNFEYPGVGDVYLGLDFQSEIDEYKRQVDDEFSMLRLGGNYHLTEQLTVGTDFRYDFLHGEMLETTLRFMWKGECWDIGLEYSRTQNDNRFGITFNILEF